MDTFDSWYGHHARARVLVLRHVADLTEPGITEVLGVSRGTVSSTLRDAHRRIARHLAEESMLASEPEELDR